MQPIDELLHRIRWDPAFRGASWAIGYLDRVLEREVVVPFTALSFDAGSPGAFAVEDHDGVVRRIPMHRIRVVYRDGVEVWRRAAPGGGPRHTRRSRDAGPE